MQWCRSWLLALLGVGLCAVVPARALAQGIPGWDWSVAVFGGGAFSFNTLESDTASMRDSISFGGKVQAWTPVLRARTGLDIGAELDVTQWYPDITDRGSSGSGGTNITGGSSRVGRGGFIGGNRDVSATMAAVNLLVRLPVGISAAFPRGRWHPYVGIGGGAEIARATLSGGTSDTDVAPALQVLGGSKVFLTTHIGLFVEYKFTHAAHSFNYATSHAVPGTDRDDITFDTNHVVGGVAFHF